jgi:hypothetical protein
MRMKRKVFYIFLSALLGMPCFLKAQDTLKVLQYNLLYYGNYQSGYADCYETNNNTQQKDEYIRTILDYVKPDIFTVCEFGATTALHNDFLRHNLNTGNTSYWQTDNIINYAGSNIINHIFFDSRKLGMKKHLALRTNPRDTDIYELYLKTPSLAAGDTINLICIVAHLKAGNKADDRNKRLAQLQTTMYYVSQHYAKDNILIMGDFNLYGASENAYKLLTQTYSDPDALFKDPLYEVGGVGEWNYNSQYAAFHTQATRHYSEECFSGGGLDDRFDFIMMSYEIAYGYDHLRYVRNSYKAVGNDGRHFNQSVNQGTNTAVPSEVADALYGCSDHLPVTMKLFADVSVGVDESEMPPLEASVAPNPASDAARVHFFNPTESKVQFELYTLQGQQISQQSGHFSYGSQQFELDLQDVSEGFYLLRIRHSDGWGQTIKLIIR